MCGPGTMIGAGEPGVVHCEMTDGYRAVFGFDHRTLTMPIDKPPVDG